MRTINPIMHRWSDLIAILPLYDHLGRDITRFHYTDGSHCDFHAPITTALEEICHYLHVNRKTLLAQSAAYLNGRTRKVPLSLRKGFCLVPVTARKERYTTKHSPVGFIVQQQADMVVRESGNYTTVTFQNSSQFLTFPQSKRTVEHQLELAETLVAYFRHY